MLLVLESGYSILKYKYDFPHYKLNLLFLSISFLIHFESFNSAFLI